MNATFDRLVKLTDKPRFHNALSICQEEAIARVTRDSRWSLPSDFEGDSESRLTLRGSATHFLSFALFCDCGAVDTIKSLNRYANPPLPADLLAGDAKIAFLNITQATIAYINSKAHRYLVDLAILYLINAYDAHTVAAVLGNSVNAPIFDAMREVYATGVLDPARFTGLTAVTKLSNYALVYLHIGSPAQVDGPSERLVHGRLLYVGSAWGTTQAKGLSGGAARVFSKNRGHTVS